MPSSQSTGGGTNQDNSCKELQEFFTPGNTDAAEISPNNIIGCFIQKHELNIQVGDLIDLITNKNKDKLKDIINNIDNRINTDAINNSNNSSGLDTSSYETFMKSLKDLYNELYNSNNKNIKRSLSNEKFEFINTCYDKDSAQKLKNSLDKLKEACDNGCSVVLALAASYAAMLSSDAKDVGVFEWYPYAANARVLAAGVDSSIPLCPRWGDVFAILYYLSFECESIFSPNSNSNTITRDEVLRCLLGMCQDSSSQGQ